MIKAAAIQIHSVPGEKERNIEQAKTMVYQAAEQGANLIALPELWSTGYYLDYETFDQLSETPEGKTVTLFQKIAKELQVVLIVPFVEKENNELYIAAAVIEKTGEVLDVYRKSFVWGIEQKVFTDGERSYKLYETSVGKLGVLICYDIEFPEPSRLLALSGVDLIIVPSVWSIPAETRWDIQLPARALDNTVFVMGVNTVKEGSCGKSKFLAPDGSILREAPREDEAVLTCDIDLDLIAKVRSKVPYLEEYDHSLTPGLKASDRRSNG